MINKLADMEEDIRILEEILEVKIKEGTSKEIAEIKEELKQLRIKKTKYLKNIEKLGELVK